jgi:hypothetical protein
MKTVFIIGAGASNEIGMPIGIGLKDNIIDILSGVMDIINISNPDLGQNTNKLEHIHEAKSGIIDYYYKSDLNKICEAYDNLDKVIQSLELTSSIDNLLYNFRDSPDIQAIGKIAIVTAILKAENECALVQPSMYKKIKPSLEGTWYHSLFLELNKRASLDEFVRRLNNIYFIIFNYDRTLEYYLYNSIMKFYKTSTEKTIELIKGMNIYHPYGQTGFLECQNGKIKHPFGNLSRDNMYSLSTQIKTFILDNFADDDEYKNACNFLYGADKVFFLGFAFYSQNIDLLFPKKITSFTEDENTKIRYAQNVSYYYGTFYKIPKVAKSAIIKNIKEKNERISSFIGKDMKCVDFFNEFSNIISFC